MADPILDDGLVIEVAGKQFKMRRLSAKDVWRFVRVMARTSRLLGPTADRESLALAAGFLLAEGFSDAEMSAFLADIVGLTPEELDRQPPEVVPAILKALAEHQDMQAFFEACVKAAEAAVSLFTKPLT